MIRTAIHTAFVCLAFCCPILAQVPAQNPPSKAINLTFAGDLMAHIPNYSHRPFSNLYQGVQEILKADDLSFVNLEFPIDDTKPYAAFPLFNVHSEYPWAAIMAGFDVFSLANNHSADKGITGVARSDAAMRVLQVQSGKIDRPIWYNGLRPRADSPQYSLTTIEYKGFRIGFVAIAEWVNIPSLKQYVQFADCREIPVPDGLLEWIRSVRPGLDLFVLSYHWGEEYAPKQNKVRAEFSRKLVDAGVDILWGTHPHVLQPWYTLESVRGTALILPSLGNFVSGQTWDLGSHSALDRRAPRGDSALFGVQIAVDSSGKIGISNTTPVLISTWTNPQGQMVARLLDDLAENLKGPWQKYYIARRETIRKTFVPQ